jgi:ketosteroid isomerase-like protein
MKESAMSEEQMAGIMREFVKEMAAGNSEKAGSYLTEDAVWATPYGDYRGRNAIKQYLVAMARNMKDMKVAETGNGIVVKGDKAFFEHVISATYQGKKCEVLAMCAYEFSGDKIKTMRTAFDRLLMAQQAVKGWPATPIVNMVARQTEKAVK